MKNLRELTGQESGIVIHVDGTAIICNWSDLDGIPRIFATGLVGLPDDLPAATNIYHTDNLDPVYDDIMDVYDHSAEQEEELPLSGTVYDLADGTIIIAPDSWA